MICRPGYTAGNKRRAHRCWVGNFMHLSSHHRPAQDMEDTLPIVTGNYTVLTCAEGIFKTLLESISCLQFDTFKRKQKESVTSLPLPCFEHHYPVLMRHLYNSVNSGCWWWLCWGDTWPQCFFKILASVRGVTKCFLQRWWPVAQVQSLYRRYVN